MLHRDQLSQATGTRSVWLLREVEIKEQLCYGSSVATTQIREIQSFCVVLPLMRGSLHTWRHSSTVSNLFSLPFKTRKGNHNGGLEKALTPAECILMHLPDSRRS